MQLAFTKQTDTGTITNLPVTLKSVADGTTAGVTYSGTNLTIPAGNGSADVKAVFRVTLGGETSNDDGETKVAYTLTPATTLPLALAAGDDSIREDTSVVGSPTAPVYMGRVKVTDSDLNTLSLSFADAVGTWAGGEAVYIPSGDPRTRLYESQASSNPIHTVTAKLSRALETQDGTTNTGMRWVVSAPSGLNIAASGTPTTNTPINLDFAVGETTKTFFVRSTGTASSAAATFVTSTVTAAPSFADPYDVHNNFVSPDDETINHILLDNNNTFALATAALEVAEGARAPINLGTGGVAVTAPATSVGGGAYTVTVHTEAAASGTHPQAIPNTEYPANFTITKGAGESITPSVKLGDSAVFGSADNLITGDRYFALSHMVIAPANRGANAQADGAQTPVSVKLTDPTTAGRIGFAAGGATTLSASARHNLTSSTIGESATKYPFNIVLDKAHRRKRSGRKRHGRAFGNQVFANGCKLQRD